MAEEEARMTVGPRVWIADALAEAADAAVGRAVGLVVEAMVEAVPELARSPGRARLEGEEGVRALRRYLGVIEREMERFCAPHEFRTLLMVSRICSGLGRFRAHEPGVGDTMTRCQPADYAALAFGRRDLPDLVSRAPDGSYWFGPTGSVAPDVVALHRLAREHRGTVTALLVSNFLTELRREENRGGGRKLGPLRVEATLPRGVPPTATGELGMAFGTGFRLLADEEALGYAAIFLARHSSRAAPMSPWGWIRLREDQLTSPAALWMPFADARAAAHGAFFVPQDRGIASLYENGERFREIFDERVGMPPAHLCSVLQGLSQLAFDRELTTVGEPPAGGVYPTVFFGQTGTMLLDHRDVEGGALLEKSAEALNRDYPGVVEAADLGASVARFVELASSSGKRGTLGLRGMRPAFLLHGEPHHETLLVDLNATMVFVQHLHDLLEVSEGTRTADPDSHDADVRTSLFDAQLARHLERVEGVDLAFADRRVRPDLPNVRPPMSPGEDLEVDVPLRVGSVLVPVQTRTSPVDPRLDEGDYDAFRRRWKATKDKRRKTDKRYAAKLLGDPTAREFLRAEGVTHVLPVVCSPYPDPVAAAGRGYWLRHPSDEPRRAVLEGRFRAVPRVLAPEELDEFLRSADEDELKRVSESISGGDWTL